MMTHDLFSVAGGIRSFAQLSRDPAVSTAVVFVHGFKGRPWSTWADFQTLASAPADPSQRPFRWNECDLYFYGYDSTHTRIGVNAAKLTSFLSGVFPSPSPKLFQIDVDLVRKALSVDIAPHTFEGDGRKYSRLVLVAHSEGGVVVRKSVLDAVKQHKIEPFGVRLWQAGLVNATLCLFAPALMGASPSGWKGAILPALNALPEFLSAPLQAWLGGAAAYGELQPSSRVLDALQRATESYWQESPYFFGLQAAICWGEQEDVVAVGEYTHDWPIKHIPRQDHISVCKPGPGYLAPVEFLWENYERGRYPNRAPASVP